MSDSDTDSNDCDRSQAAIIEYWRAVELFAPQPLPKLRDVGAQVCVVDDSGLLPWDRRHPMRGQRILRDKQAWRHVVYCGVYSLDGAFTDVRRRFPARGEQEQELAERPQAGSSALVAFVVADDGRPVLGSVQLASCAWAISSALKEGLDSVATGAFENVAYDFRTEWEEMVAADEQDERAAELEREGHLVGAPIDADGLQACMELAADVLALGELGNRDTLRSAQEIRIVSRVVSEREAYEPGDREFLNSFYASDLGKVRLAVEKGAHGLALREYLTRADELDPDRRIDVERELSHVRRAVGVRKMPLGRWPSAPSSSPGLGQQLALNTILAGAGQRLFAVNGPPGTGKTVMLRDLIAAVVVERARRLADLEHPREAFGSSLSWPRADRRVYPLKQEYAGFELVLACATNAAAENVTREIPAVEAIDSCWHEQVDYFADVATKMLTAPRSATERPAWAMVAGVLGSRAKNKTFVSRFWWEGLQETWPTSESQPWAQAVADFQDALSRVQELQDQRAAYGDLFEQREDAEAQQACTSALAAQVRARLPEFEQELHRRQQATQLASDACQQSERQRAQHRQTRPGLWRRLFTAATKDWRAQDERIAQEIAHAKAREIQTRAEAGRLAKELAELSEEIERNEQEAAAAEANVHALHDQITQAGRSWAKSFPDVVFPDEQWQQPQRRKSRERQAPWSDEALNCARTELFLAALTLHRAFIAGARKQMRATLRSASELISGQAGEVSLRAAKAAWQALFVAVPLVSTTFASFSYLFRHVDKETLGWLLVDEAGQANPQAAVGALWRAKRAVIVGDPMQLEPIVQLPRSIENRLREHHGVGIAALPQDTSVQRLADQVAAVGTYRGACELDERIWVGVPLNVHRRCEEPMFQIVNEIAYEGQMINCTPAREATRLPESHWVDVPSVSSHGNWLPAEGDALDHLLEELGRDLYDYRPRFAGVFAITPFKDVARQIAKRAKSYEGLTAGTVHVAQGREADVVILVLGGNPHFPGARAWAAEKPNLLNVAVSRARRRLYVIGDHAAWSKLPYFRALASNLDVRTCAQASLPHGA